MRDSGPAPLLTDSPSPGIGYLLFIILVFGGVLAAVAAGDGSAPGERVAQFGVGLLMAGLFVLMLHAALRTSYRVEGSLLHMRSGVFRSTVDLRSVRGIERCGFNQRTLGWSMGGSRGFCNRFTNGVRMRSGGDYVFISPSDPEQFVRRLEVYISERYGRPPSV